MLGLMQDWPLLCHKILDHAATYHGDRRIISRSLEGPFHETTYREIQGRSLRCAKRLDQAGIRLGDRVATLAWNTWRHLEVWYGALGIGAVYHTVNPRLFPDQIAWILNDAGSRLIFVDLTFVPIVERIADRLEAVEQVIVLTDATHMPETALAGAIPYEDWLAEADGDFAWARFDENNAAGLCYTSGTTGDPKGVVYSHRSNVLHGLVAALPDCVSLSASDVVMPVVPMFHANCWAYCFAVPVTGGTFVLPGGKMDGASIYEMLDTFKVTKTGAVPTVWLMLLKYLQDTGKTLPHLKSVIIGGSACPRAMAETFEKTYQVEVLHAWGMTEMSPLGTVCSIKPDYSHLRDDALFDIKETQGHPPFTVEMKVTDDAGRKLPWDGKTFGRLKVRGPAVSKSYFKGAGGDILDEEGFFDTGDVAHIDPQGYMRITDRSKDIIKSGGEWISSIDLENLAVGHPDVAEAAVIGVRHPTWDERPLLVVVPREGSAPDGAAILDYLRGKVAKWWLPDEVVFVDAIPHTAAGKIRKTALREQFADFRFADADTDTE